MGFAYNTTTEISTRSSRSVCVTFNKSISVCRVGRRQTWALGGRQLWNGDGRIWKASRPSCPLSQADVNKMSPPNQQGNQMPEPQHTINRAAKLSWVRRRSCKDQLIEKRKTWSLQSAAFRDRHGRLSTTMKRSKLSAYQEKAWKTL